MSGYAPSRCPLDRSSFTHMPAVNKTLHRALALAFPASYAARAVEVAAEEAATGPSEDVGPLPPPRGLTVSDFGCATCGLLLAAPVALNCGCTVCSSCVPPGRLCTACGATGVVSRPPAVCALLATTTEALFPQAAADAAARASSTAVVAVEETAADDDNVTTNPPETQHCWYGIGCDACGEFPIVGRRYTCATCARTSRMGYDLCGPCADAGAAERGGAFRFGQRHEATHEVARVPPARTALHAMVEAHPELIMEQLLALIRLAATRDPPVQRRRREGAELSDGDRADDGGSSSSSNGDAALALADTELDAPP